MARLTRFGPWFSLFAYSLLVPYILAMLTGRSSGPLDFPLATEALAFLLPKTGVMKSFNYVPFSILLVFMISLPRWTTPCGFFTSSLILKRLVVVLLYGFSNVGLGETSI